MTRFLVVIFDRPIPDNLDTSGLPALGTLGPFNNVPEGFAAAALYVHQAWEMHRQEHAVVFRDSEPYAAFVQHEARSGIRMIWRDDAYPQLSEHFPGFAEPDPLHTHSPELN